MTKLARSTNEYRHISTSQQSLGVYPGATDAAAWKAYTEEESSTPEPDAGIRFGDCVILPYNKDVWENLDAENRLLVCAGMPVHPADEYDTITSEATSGLSSLPGFSVFAMLYLTRTSADTPHLEIVTTPSDLQWALDYLAL